jgi:hypothetical protein
MSPLISHSTPSQCHRLPLSSYFNSNQVKLLKYLRPMSMLFSWCMPLHLVFQGSDIRKHQVLQKQPQPLETL